MPLIEIVPYQESWVQDFASIADQIRRALGDTAIAIHHIGSTSVPGMPAKDVIDIQVTVLAIDSGVEKSMQAAGFVLAKFRLDHCPPGETLGDDELAKLLFGSQGHRAHIHVRQVGRFNQRYALLCRDYLRSHQSSANAYAQIKRQLARYFPDDVGAYYDIKDPVFDVIMAAANEWARLAQWTTPQSDA